MVDELWPEYSAFCRIRERAQASGTCDLSGERWLYPTKLLALGGFLVATGTGYIPPQDEDVASYFSLMMSRDPDSRYLGKSYIPIVRLPTRRDDANRVIRRIYELHENGKGVGGRNAFAYMIGELVDNIYEHSRFTNAYLMAQKYEKKGFVEVSFYDDGMTIGRSLRDAGHESPSDHIAIQRAVAGLSAKKSLERGYGLSSNVKLSTNGLNGRMLIVSGSGALESWLDTPGRTVAKAYPLEQTIYMLQGTLISIRIPYPAQEVDIYEFAE